METLDTEQRWSLTSVEEDKMAFRLDPFIRNPYNLEQIGMAGFWLSR